MLNIILKYAKIFFKDTYGYLYIENKEKYSIFTNLLAQHFVKFFI